MSAARPGAAAVTSLARYTMRTAALLRETPAAILMDLNAALLMGQQWSMRSSARGQLDEVGEGERSSPQVEVPRLGQAADHRCHLKIDELGSSERLAAEPGVRGVAVSCTARSRASSWRPRRPRARQRHRVPGSVLLLRVGGGRDERLVLRVLGE